MGCEPQILLRRLTRAGVLVLQRVGHGYSNSGCSLNTHLELDLLQPRLSGLLEVKVDGEVMGASVLCSNVRYAIIQVSSMKDHPERLVIAYPDENWLRDLIATPSIVGLGFASGEEAMAKLIAGMPDSRTSKHLVLRPCRGAKGEAGNCWSWTTSGRSGPAQPLEMIGIEQGAYALSGHHVHECRRFDSRRESAFSFARSELYPRVQAVFQLPNVPGKWQAVSLFIVGNGSGLDILVDRTRRLGEVD